MRRGKSCARYNVLAGLWGSPISGASMNPACTFGPNFVGQTLTGYRVHVAGPVGSAALAVVIAFHPARPGGGHAGSGAAQATSSPSSKNPASLNRPLHSRNTRVNSDPSDSELPPRIPGAIRSAAAPITSAGSRQQLAVAPSGRSRP